MRAIALLVLLSGPVAAEPAKPEPAKPEPAKPEPAKPEPAKPAKPVTMKLPDLVKEATANTQLPRPGGVLGVDGKVATGIVIEPPDHPDARAYGQGGAVITPPDPNDPMALELGTMQLRSRTAREAWLPRDLSRSVKRGADHVWDLLLPKL